MGKTREIVLTSFLALGLVSAPDSSFASKEIGEDLAESEILTPDYPSLDQLAAINVDQFVAELQGMSHQQIREELDRLQTDVVEMKLALKRAEFDKDGYTRFAKKGAVLTVGGLATGLTSAVVYFHANKRVVQALAKAGTYVGGAGLAGGLAMLVGVFGYGSYDFVMSKIEVYQLTESLDIINKLLLPRVRMELELSGG